jgi:hypothetical protein
MQFKVPPVIHNEQGKLRTVGFELEFSKLGIGESVRIIQELYGGEQHFRNRFSQQVTGTRLGDFLVEFDLTLLSEKSYKKVFQKFNINIEGIKLGAGTLEDELENVIERIAGKLFPYEIATPPVPCTELEQLEQLRDALHRHQAGGTDDFFTNAFGTHINVEVPSLDTGTLLNYLRAFLLLYPWLLQVGKTDFARKMSPFIDAYPDNYIDLVLSPVYHPDLDILIADYNRFNPDRNRPLDMYPVFAYLNPEMLTRYKDLGKVKPRRTFHYRLPNSSISDPNWTLAQEWNNWVAVEELANNNERLSRMCEDYLELKKNTFLGFNHKWIQMTEQWLAY